MNKRSISISSSIFSQRNFIMGVAMICIMLFHQEFSSSVLLVPFSLFGHFGVDVFFFMSGMGIAASLKRNSLLQFYCNRGNRLFPAWLFVIAVAYVAMWLLSDVSIKTHLVNWIWLSWFLDVLLVFYIFSPWLLRLVNNIGYSGVAVITFFTELIVWSYATGWIFPDANVISIVELGFPRLPVFLLGMLMLDSKWQADRAHSLVLLLVLSIALMGALWRLNLAVQFIPLDYLCLRKGLASDCLAFPMITFAVAPVCLFWARIGQRMNESKYGKVIALFGVLSLELYLWHPWLFKHMRSLMSQFSLNGVVTLILAFVVSIMLAWFTHCFCRRCMGLVQSKLKSQKAS